MNLNLGDTQLIIAEGRKRQLLRNQLAYVLATAFHETAHTMKPVRETLATSDAQAISRLDAAWNKGQLKWVKTPYWRDGWFGRGYVQLTHKANYEKASIKLGVDLVSNPSKAMDPHTAAAVLVVGSKEGWFTGKKLSDYITLKTSDFVNARRIINGTDRASDIAAIARQYDADLKLAGYGEVSPIPDREDKTVFVPKQPDDPGIYAQDKNISKNAGSVAAAIVIAIGGVLAILFGLS